MKLYQFNLYKKNTRKKGENKIYFKNKKEKQNSDP